MLIQRMSSFGCFWKRAIETSRRRVGVTSLSRASTKVYHKGFSTNGAEITSSLRGPPVSMLVPPGGCQLGDEFQPVELVDRVKVSPSSSVLRFQLPDSTRPLQLSTCACILARAEIPNKTSKSVMEAVIRPYTPISTNALVGYMDLLVKNYPTTGTMSKFLHEVEIGSTSISFKHIPFNVKIQAPFQQKHIIMLAGGTGITPMIQALHSILGMDDDSLLQQRIPNEQKVTLLYGSQHSQDILTQPLLDAWAKAYPTKLDVVHVVSDEPSDSSWSGKHGRIEKELLDLYLPSPLVGENVIILVCGPTPMYHALCGPREEQESISGILGDMGFSSQQVYKF